MKDLNDLRDEFASQALLSLIRMYKPSLDNAKELAGDIASVAYDCADAMVVESVRRRVGSAMKLKQFNALAASTESA